MAAEKTSNTTRHLRLVDANLNRLKEGVRVVEEIARFILNDKELSVRLKSIRHKARISNLLEALDNREVIGDVLRTQKESQKSDINAVAIANFKRAEESARVLEEFCDQALFKEIRYELYDTEKLFFKKLQLSS